jgi:hypothetical protein
MPLDRYTPTENSAPSFRSARRGPPMGLIVGALALGALVFAIVVLVALDFVPLPVRLGIVVFDVLVIALVAWILLRPRRS